PQLARPGLGGDGALGPAPAGARRRARRGLRRRGAGRAAGAALAPLRMPGLQYQGRAGRLRTPAAAGERGGHRGRHARPALRSRELRPGGADARADLVRAARQGGGGGGPRAPARGAPAADQPGPAWPPGCRGVLRPRQPGLHRQGAGALHHPRRAAGHQLRHRHARAAPAALRGDRADRTQAGGWPRQGGTGAMNTLPWLEPARAEALLAALEERILVLDGAMGTMIQQHRLQEADYRGARFADAARDQRGNNDLLSLTRPDLIAGIHRAYLEAGADLVETNTFNSTSISLADYGLAELARELNAAGARLAREACAAATMATPGRPRF